MELLGNIFTGIFAVFGAFILFFLFAILVTIGIGLYLWYRIKKQFRQTVEKEFGDPKNQMNETIIDVEGKENK